MKKVAAVLVIFILGGCDLLDPPPPPPPHHYTFEEVSQPYLDQYGPAEEDSTYTSGSYSSIDWWWWTKGFEVTFLDSPYDDVLGWTVDSTYSFDPIP
jgi:hypothetical protein